MLSTMLSTVQLCRALCTAVHDGVLRTVLSGMHALHNPVHTVQHNKILCKNYAVEGAMFTAMPRAMLGAM